MLKMDEKKENGCTGVALATLAQTFLFFSFRCSVLCVRFLGLFENPGAHRRINGLLLRLAIVDMRGFA